MGIIFGASALKRKGASEERTEVSEQVQQGMLDAYKFKQENEINTPTAADEYLTKLRLSRERKNSL